MKQNTNSCGCIYNVKTGLIVALCHKHAHLNICKKCGKAIGRPIQAKSIRNSTSVFFDVGCCDDCLEIF